MRFFGKSLSHRSHDCTPTRRPSRNAIAFALAGAVALGATLTAARPALAAPPNPAKTLYDKGATEYNLGHFAEAIVNFEKAYELDPAPILLFNIAQSHRQSGNNERALFFYRRYLEQAAPDATNRADVEKRVKDLEEVLAQQSEIKRKPPTQVEDHERRLPAGGTSPQVTPTLPPTTTPATQAAVTPPPPPAPPPATTVAAPVTTSPPQAHDDDTVRARLNTAPSERPFRVGVDLGGAFSQFHGLDLEQPGQFHARLFGGYLVTSTPLPIEVGAALSFSPLPYKTLKEEKTGSLTGLWARAAALFPVGSGFDLLGELGLGVVWFGGIEAGNPFTKDGTSATGAIPMPSFRLAVGVRYELPVGLFAYALPGFTYSKTTSGLSDSISSITRFELPVGLGYSF